MNGFSDLQREKALTTAQLVVSVMHNGKYSTDMACTALLRAQQHTRGEANITDTLFYNVCAWLYSTPRVQLQKYRSPGALTAAISKDINYAASGIRSCLAYHPFDLPAWLVPVKYSAKKTLTTTDARPALSTTPPAPALRPLAKVIALQGYVAHDDRARELFNELFKDELAEIARRLS